MKIGIFSDIHLEHRSDHDWPALLDRIAETAQGVDLLINVGDTHHNLAVRLMVKNVLTKKVKCQYVEVLGNHDYYGHEWKVEAETFLFGDLKLYAGTMWTDFNGDPLAAWKASRCITDFRQIWDVSEGKMKEAFAEFQGMVKELKPDVVVSHFAPHEGSVHERFKGDDLNAYFVPDCTKTIELVQPKLWIHGHVHNPCDYTVGDTRVVANPLGYPRETYRYITDYSVKVIEI